MFIANDDRSCIAYKDLVNNNVLVFNQDGDLINQAVQCNDWQLINLFEVPSMVLVNLTNIIK